MTNEQHRRVLVVDDDPTVREILRAALRQKSLTVDAASDGKEAIEFLREHTYGVVLLDLLMPVADGFDVLDSIDTSGPNPSVVLVVSGADRATLERLDARRIHGVVRKPFEPQDVAAIVAACVDIRGNRALETMALAMMSGSLFSLLDL